MSDGSTIEWTDATWQPITGCSIVSPGCTNCYAMKLAGTRLRNHPSRDGLTVDSNAGPVWNGEVRFNAQWLGQPLSWRRPRKIFVCAHGDLFHENVPDQWIDAVFAVMTLAPRHSFQVLTKRASRMRAYLKAEDRRYQIELAMHDLGGDYDAQTIPDDDWPLPNVWLGVSAERQQEVNERVPELLATPAAVRFISAEPLLGPLNLRDINGRFDRMPSHHDHFDALRIRGGLDWVIAGGESGAGARPMHPDWARSLRDQCAAAIVPFLFKQWGEWAFEGQLHADGKRRLRWPADCESHQPIGKRQAGRYLDGVEHNGFPQGACT